MEWWDKMHDTGLIVPICPHWSLIQNLYRQKDYKQLIEYDLQILTRCDALFKIFGKSNGANIESKFMKKMQRPIFLENQYNDLIKWAKLWISQQVIIS